MAGRGRGRGALAKSQATTSPGGLRTPHKVQLPSNSGDSASQADKESEEIFINLVADLRKLSLQSSEEYHKSIYSLVESYAKTKEKLDETVKLIYDKSLGDRHLCKNGVALCNALSGLEVDSQLFRSELLKRVHMDFKDKDFNRVDNLEKYISCAIFLCQMFLTMRTKTGELFRPLVPPIFEYLQLLVSPEAQETEAICCVRELTDLGEILEHCDTPKMNELFNSIRRKIIDEMSSSRTRLFLLQMLEQRGNGWEKLSADIDTFYKDTLKDLD